MMKDDSNNCYKIITAAVLVCASIAIFLYKSNVFTYSDTEKIISEMVLPKGN